MLFLEAPNATAARASGSAHTLSGGTGVQLMGTIHLTNTLAAMQSTPTVYQELDLTGASGSTTSLAGAVIVGKLLVRVSGGGTITMNLTALDSSSHKIALVK
jgi:hypothetical protein